MNIVEPNCLTTCKSLKRLVDGDPYGVATSGAYQGDSDDYPSRKGLFRKDGANPECLTFLIARIDARRGKTRSGLIAKRRKPDKLANYVGG